MNKKRLKRLGFGNKLLLVFAVILIVVVALNIKSARDTKILSKKEKNKHA